MDDRIGKDAKAKTLVAAALDGTLTDAQAAELAALDPSIQKLAWLRTFAATGHLPPLPVQFVADG